MKNTKIEKKEDWMNSKWRPLMGYTYMAICIADFIVFPLLWSIVQAIDKDGTVTSQWMPMTLQGAGLLHLSFATVLGVSAYGRTQEKLAISSQTPTTETETK